MSDDHEFGRQVADAYRRVGPADPAAKERLMARVRGEGPPPKLRLVTWGASEGMPWWRSAPAAAVAMAATLLLGTALGWIARDRWSPVRPSDTAAPGVADVPSTREVRLVQFVLAAPRASRVTVVGDFNAWDPQATPMTRRESGAWMASIPVSPGRHVYAFIVDGDRWVSDPAAPLAPEDGFGIRNSVIVVGGQEPT